ncbi:potassium uptake protein [Bacillus subtilis]|nr:potassium uptake protein [Bacillus subtilis]
MKIKSTSMPRLHLTQLSGDSTDESVLKNLGLRNFDHVIVAIGENIQASILTTLILKELGRPYDYS